MFERLHWSISVRFVLVLLLVGSWPISSRAAEPTREAIAQFEKDVRPLLIEQCVKCHGPKKQESSLRVDSLAALLKGGDSGPAIVPGKVDQGTLLAAVQHRGDTHMPPSGKLRPDQIAALTKWVADGAVWPADAQQPMSQAPKKGDHWAFQPVRDPQIPTVMDASWPRTDVDRFVLERMNRAGLKPIGDADKRTLIRRVTFGLTGLPPTPEEIAQFLADDSPIAFERVVNRLLASSAYGERWGRHWLDVARYADTAGDGADYPVREARFYRDWVIAAFNRDQPYDAFLRDQIAGDILARSGPAEEYANKVTATGFLAVGKRYGYNPSPDYQYLDFADVIDSVGRSVLGLSLGCARCHDHKYDPVSTADYYALYGILQSTKWAFPGGEEHKRPTNFPALVTVEEAQRREQQKAADLARVDAELRRLKVERGTIDGKFFAGGVDLAFEGQTLGKGPAGSWLAIGPNTISAEAQSPFTHIHPAGTRGVRMGTGAPNDGIRMVFDPGLRATPGQSMHFTIDFRTIAPTDKTGAYRFYLGRGVIESLAIEFSITRDEIMLRNGDKWESLRKLEPGTWYTLQASIDPMTRKYSGLIATPKEQTTFANKAVHPKWDGVVDTFICDAIGHVSGAAPVRDIDNIGLQDRAFAAPGSPAVMPPAPMADRAAKLAQLDADVKRLTQERQALAVRDPYPTAYGVSEGTPINARIQKRGEPDKLGPEVPRRFLEVLGGDALPANTNGSGRLQLAEWLTRPTNPLTARVFVNRVWQWHFGRGLVPSASDFGTRGEAPSHPELLDYLTSRFIASGWSVKELHRLILRSRVYQLASSDDATNLKIDPSNRWLWRFSRQPLDAESIRDAMLMVSGRLDRGIPGPHPFPPVESWGFTIHNPFHAVYDHSHRSVYLMVQRNRRHPYLALFDAADPNASAAERLPTTTPTQTLYLMNSPFIHEQSTAFADRLLAIPGDDAKRVSVAFEMAHGREPSPTEITTTMSFLSSYRQKLGERGIPADRQASLAWAAFARVVLTSNAFLYVD